MIILPREYAIFSGFTLTVPQFLELMRTLYPYAMDYFASHWLTYDSWRRKTGRDINKVPRLRFIGKPGVTLDVNDPETVDRLVFCTRWIDFTGDEQLQDPSLSRPNEADKVKFDEFEKYVKTRGVKLPPYSLFGFGCTKDIHLSQEGEW